MPQITFIEPGGYQSTCDYVAGETILSVARRHNINLDGSCSGILDCSMNCAACHVIIGSDEFAKLSKPSVEECDRLNLVVEVTPFSRLGCQVTLTTGLDRLTVKLP